MAEMLSRLGYSKELRLENSLAKVNRVGRDLTFSEVLKARLEQQAGVKFSAHAMDRINERSITLEQDELSRLSDAISKAGEKGVNDSLILINDKAFIVSIKNQTVVTAMAGNSTRNKVFTNIDSTLIA